jgi:hypothetical protein
MRIRSDRKNHPGPTAGTKDFAAEKLLQKVNHVKPARTFTVSFPDTARGIFVKQSGT